MNKEIILNQIDYRTFYKSFISSLKDNGKGQTKGLCPFHDDHRPSLSVNLEKGVYNCFACGAKGDVFTFYQELKKVDFPIALKEIAEMQGITHTTIKPKVVAKFEYKDAKGNTIYVKKRIEPGGNGRSKEFFFKHKENGQWIKDRRCEPLLYNLPQLIKAKSVFVVEGEGKTDLLMEWDFVSTCLDSGSNSPWREEYTKYFEGKEVVILPDNDDSGRQYASKIADALYRKVGSLKIVNLPRLQKKGDIIDWAEAEGNGRERLIEIVKTTPEWTPQHKVEINDNPEVKSDTFTTNLDFDSLPSFLKELVEMISPTTLAPDEFIVTALLSSMSSAIGTRAYIQLGRRVFYPSGWAMLIAPSSDSFKSTAIREARDFILKIDKEYEVIYTKELEDYQKELKRYEGLSKEDRTDTIEPMPPIRKEIDFSDDETLESFYQTLHDNPDGGLLAFDEIGGWIQGFDKYRRGDGEKRRWLTIFDCHPIKYKRKADKIRLVIDKPFVSVIGGITSNTFNTLFKGGITDIENGFLPRFIFCKTPQLIKKDDSFLRPDIDIDKWERAYNIFKKVVDLRSGAVAPSPDGMKMINDWYKQHQAQKKDPFYPEELSPFWRRMEGYFLKIALIFHQFKRATGEESSNLISIQTLGEAMALAEYYKGQAWAVVRELCQGKDGKVFDGLINLLKKLGGKATLRQIQQAKACWRGKRDDLIEVLKKMEVERLVSLKEYVSGGRKGIEVILNP